MIDDIKAMQEKVEGRQFTVQPAIENAALQLYKVDPELAVEFLSEYCTNNANRVVNEWWEFGQSLVTRYNDGYVDGKSVGYPDWWLKEVGYEDGPQKYGLK
jgi:hypothetical protein